MPFDRAKLPAGHLLFPAPTYFDETEFFGRSDNVLRLIEMLNGGSSVAISGKRRVGRSWFLQHLRSALPSDRFIVVDSDELKPDTIIPRHTTLFLFALINTLYSALKPMLPPDYRPLLLDASKPPSNIGQAFYADLKQLHSHLLASAHLAVILIDEAEALLEFKDEEELVPSIVRHLATKYPQFRVIVAGFDLRAPVSKLPTLFTAFIPYQLYGIGSQGAYDLIVKRLKQYDVEFYSTEVWTEVKHLTGKEPILLRLLGQQLVEQARKNKGIIGQAQVDQAIERFFAMSQVISMMSYAWDFLGTNQPIHDLLIALAYNKTGDKAVQNKLVQQVRQLYYQLHPANAVKNDFQRLHDLGFLYEDPTSGCSFFSSDLLRRWICQQRANPNIKL